MTAAARHARSGAVTVAARQAITTAGRCEPGDVLGAVEGDFAVVGQDLHDGRRRGRRADARRRRRAVHGDRRRRRRASSPSECAEHLASLPPHRRRARLRRAARSATRCCSGWSDGGRLGHQAADRRGRPYGEAARRAPGDRDGRASCSTHYPRRYLDLDEVSTVEELVEGELVTLVVDVGSAQVHPYQDKRTKRTAYRTEVRARLGDGRGLDDVLRPLRARGRTAGSTSQLGTGQHVILSGKVRPQHVQEAPVGADPPRGRRGRGGHLRPHAGLPAVREAAQRAGPATRSGSPSTWSSEVPDVLPAAPRGRARPPRGRRWRCGGSTGRTTASRPVPRRSGSSSTRRSSPRWPWRSGGTSSGRSAAEPRTGRAGGIFDAFDARMPFELTAGQRRVEEEILADLAGEHPMQRLLQGEVGLGQDGRGAAGDAAGRRLRRPGGAAGSDRGARPAAPPLDHRACSATSPRRAGSARRTRRPGWRC